MKQVKGTKHSGPDSELKGTGSVQLKWMDFHLFKWAGDLALKIRVRKAQAGCLQLPKNQHASDKHRNEAQGQCRLISLYPLASYFIPSNKLFICRILDWKLERKKGKKEKKNEKKKRKKVVFLTLPVTHKKPPKQPTNLFSSSTSILQLKRSEQKWWWIASPSFS